MRITELIKKRDELLSSISILDDVIPKLKTEELANVRSQMTHYRTTRQGEVNAINYTLENTEVRFND